MTRVWINICLIAAITLASGVIWPDSVTAQSAPQLQRLGQIKEGLRVPARIDVDAAGNLYVADSRLQLVVKFDRFGRQLTRFTQVKASGAGLAVNANGSRVYVAAFDKVAVYATAGELIGYLGQGAGEFGTAGAIDLDRDGNIYVADLNQRRVKVYTPDMTNCGTLGSVSFVASSDLAIDPNTDHIYIAESATAENSGIIPQVRVFDRLGTQLRSINADTGFGATAMLFFGGMTFDRAGHFYVGDVAGKSVRILNSSATALLNYAEYSISRPASLAYDEATGRLFVLRSDRQIDIYGVNGGRNPRQVNSAPNTPLPTAPIAGSEVATLTPLFQFENAVDPDALDEISYTLRVYDGAQRLVTSFDLAQQPTLTSGRIAVPLQEDGYYSWQVQAFDGEEVSAWSDLQSFYVNAENTAPSAPQLLAPLAGAKVVTDSLLRWLESVDSDPFDRIHYLVEVATDSSFNNKLVSKQVSGTELALSAFSAALQPGHDYYWQVSAVDNHAATQRSTADGRFSYQASTLSITANMPGARVYLGGQQNYAGQFVGEAPLELRDLPPGRYQLVVERAGFEPFLQPVEIYPAALSAVAAQLQPALIPAALTFMPLPVQGKQFQGIGAPAPLIVDLDLDGVEDLLLVAADGRLQYYPGAVQADPALAGADRGKRLVEFTSEQPLDVPRLSGTALCLIDWNNDFQPDLLVGGADGSVHLYLNRGSFSFAAEGQWLAGVTGQAVPTVADIDQDGDKDLVVGSGVGELVLFRNVGSDSAPQLAAPQLLVTFAEAAAPSFVDWDADGQRELLVAADGQLYRALYAAGGLSSLTLVETSAAQIARLNALDLDGVGGKDLVVGTADGRLLLAAAAGTQFVAEFYPALQAKLLQIKSQLTDEQAAQLPLLDLMSAALAERRLDELRDLNEELIFQLPAAAAATLMASELAIILP